MSLNFPSPAYAQGINLGQELKLGTSSNTAVADVYKTPADLINLMTSNLMMLGGIVLFVMVIFAGFKFIKDDNKAKEEAKKIMKTALAGFLLMFSAYWIVQIVKFITGANIIL